MIALKNVSKSFGDIPAVRDMSFHIPEGRITIVTGADGAGKSTLFKMLVGLVRRDSGQILLHGEDIGHDYQKLTAVTGYMPERFSLYPDLSVEENLNFFADIHRVSRKTREERKHQLLEKTGMSPFKKRRAGALSGGMKQKLALSSILLSAPKFIILDEPTTGVDPLSRIEFFNIIDGLKKEGKTIIISTPYLDEAELGDHLVFFKNGRIIKQDSMTRLKTDFPARLFNITPKGNLFQIMEALNQDQTLRRKAYIRGKFIKLLQEESDNDAHKIPHLKIREEDPRLEDIYLYYERLDEERTEKP